MYNGGTVPYRDDFVKNILIKETYKLENSSLYERV
jgi:hypothetical protein